MADGICDKCGQPIDFRYVDGMCRPIHRGGGCPAAEAGWGGGDAGGRGRRADWWQHTECGVPGRCPKCGDEVFFVRHNGGAVWFDDLGWPWPKHGCFDGENAQSTMDWVFVRATGGDGEEPFGIVVKVARYSDPSFSAKLLAISVSNQTGVCVRVDVRSPLGCGHLVVLDEMNENDVILLDTEGEEHKARIVSPATLDLTPQFIKKGAITKTRRWKRSLGKYAPGKRRDDAKWTDCAICDAKVTKKKLNRHMRKVHGKA